MFIEFVTVADNDAYPVELVLGALRDAESCTRPCIVDHQQRLILLSSDVPVEERPAQIERAGEIARATYPHLAVREP